MTILCTEYFNQNAIRVGLNQFLGAFAKLRKANVISVMSVCPSVPPAAWINWAPTRRIFMKFNIRVFLEKNIYQNFFQLWQ